MLTYPDVRPDSDFIISIEKGAKIADAPGEELLALRLEVDAAYRTLLELGSEVAIHLRTELSVVAEVLSAEIIRRFEKKA